MQTIKKGGISAGVSNDYPQQHEQPFEGLGSIAKISPEQQTPLGLSSEHRLLVQAEVILLTSFSVFAPLLIALSISPLVTFLQ